MARLLRFVAVVALVGGATASLTACSGDPGPIVTETPSPTRTVDATPSPSPTPTVTPASPLDELPDFALQEDALGAGTFAVYFVASFQTMYDNNDPSLYELVSAPSCEFCADALAQHEAFVADQRSTAGGRITSPFESVLGTLQSDGTWLVQFPIDIEPLTTYDAGGEVIETLPGEHYGVGVELEHSGGLWMVLGVNHEEIG